MNIEYITDPNGIREITTGTNEQKVCVLFFNATAGDKTCDLTIRPGKNGNLTVVMACAISRQAKLKVVTHQVHEKESGWSDFLCKSVIRDNGKFDYRGHIHIAPTGQHSHAYQRNENLLLSEAASVISEPNLEIRANDVFCTHGATTGYLSDETVFYLASRGLLPEKIEKLYSMGFLLSIGDKLLSAGLTVSEIELVHKKLESLLRYER